VHVIDSTISHNLGGDGGGISSRSTAPAREFAFLRSEPEKPVARRSVRICGVSVFNAPSPMSDVTQILSQIESGDPIAADRLLPLVYDELRKLAAAKLAHEKPGQTLQATALVHEAYLRLVDVHKTQHWNGRAHFFGAAAEAMRRILVDNARDKLRLKRGGHLQREELNPVDLIAVALPEDMLAVEDALNALARVDPQAAELVKLRYYAGFTVAEAAELIGISRSTAYDHWAYARAWLRRELGRGDGLLPD
jgi:RNA polymerase sigma factor (TIGR02999 family)